MHAEDPNLKEIQKFQGNKFLGFSFYFHTFPRAPVKCVLCDTSLLYSDDKYEF